jgi:hypothetical protein
MVDLAKRGVVGGGVESHCVLCSMGLEKESHLFGCCAFASTLWSKVFNWIGWNGLVPRDPIHIWEGKWQAPQGSCGDMARGCMGNLECKKRLDF